MTVASKFACDGYVVLRAMLGPEQVQRLRRCVMPELQKLSWANPTVTNTIGASWDVAPLAELFVLPDLLATFEDIGLDEVAYFSSVLVFKVPGEARRPWHQDWWAYGQHTDPKRPPQVGVFWYLVDTTESGCLIVDPGSHVPGKMINARKLIDPSAPLAHERRIPVSAGDAVVIDARVLHAADANRSNEIRPLIAVWYATFLSRQSEAVQATVARSQHGMPALMAPVRCRYSGSAAPLNRVNYCPPIEYLYSEQL